MSKVCNHKGKPHMVGKLCVADNSHTAKMCFSKKAHNQIAIASCYE